MIGEEGRFLHRDGLRYRDGERFPDDHQDWEPGDYERFYAGPDDEYLEGLPSDVEEELQYYEVDPEQYVDGPSERKSYRWHYDNTGYYAYILFDGDAALRDDVIGKLKAKGVFALAQGRSHKPADNGRQYDWYLRVAEAIDHKLRHPRRHVVASVFGQMPLYEHDESEENLEFLRCIQQLEEQFERERRLSDDLLVQLVEGQDRTADLLRSVETLSSEIRELREARQALASRVARQGWETAEAREKAEELSSSLSEKDRELKKKEGELDDLFSEAGEVEEQASRVRTELQETKERLAAAEYEINELRRVPKPEQGTSGSPRKSTRRAEDVLGRVLEHLLPNLQFLNKRRAVSTLVKEINNSAGALKLLKQLNSDPGSFRSRPFRTAPNWREEHYNTGVDDLGRLYYRPTSEADPSRYVVHISLKDSQKADEKLLKQNS